MDSTATTPQTSPTPEILLSISDQQSTALLDDTLALFGAGTVAKAGPKAHVEIERWEAVLSASDRTGLAKIKLELRQLNELLSDPKTLAHDVAELLASLGAETAKVAEDAGNGYSTPLTNLSKLLIKAGSSLSR